MHGIDEINQINDIKKANKDWWEKAHQPKSVFGPTGRPPEPQKQAADVQK